MCTFGVLGLSCEAPATPKPIEVDLFVRNVMQNLEVKEPLGLWRLSGSRKEFNVCSFPDAMGAPSNACRAAKARPDESNQEPDQPVSPENRLRASPPTA